MNDAEVLRELRTYILDDVLEKREVDLGPQTSLLELGIFNSMEIMRMVSFIESHFGVSVPWDRVVVENFKNLTTITNFVQDLLLRHSEKP